MKEEIASIVNQLSYVESLLTKFVEYVEDEIWIERLNKVVECKSKLLSYLNLDSDELINLLLITDGLLKIIYDDMVKFKMQQTVAVK
jgi:hypothetical protein